MRKDRRERRAMVPWECNKQPSIIEQNLRFAGAPGPRSYNCQPFRKVLMEGWLKSILFDGERIAVFIALSSLVFSAVSSIAARGPDVFKAIGRVLSVLSQSSAASKRRRTMDDAYRPHQETASQVAKRRSLLRIDEAKEVMRKQISSYRWSKLSGNSLTVGQYVVGGLLASSFVRETLSTKLVGFLGIFVLLASLIKQHFHPELSEAAARQKAAQLRALIRTSEDQLIILDARIAGGQDHTDAMIALLTKITERLTEIEMADATDSKREPPGE